MPNYQYNCKGCGNSFIRYCPVEGRDCPAVCDYCGNGADRQFTPAEISIPAGFRIDKFKYNTYELAKAIDDKNEADAKKYPNTRKEHPTFEQTFQQEYRKLT